MQKHENKKCGRCQAEFECKAGSVEQCQCYGIPLSVEERAFLDSRYQDCLCRECLLQLKNRYTAFREKMYWR